MHYSVLSAFASLSFISQSLAQSNCGCYQTSAGDYFSTYQFLDFRNGKPSNFDTFFTYLNVDNYGPLDIKNTMSSANVAFTNGAMSLTTRNDGSGAQQSADMYSNPSMLYGSFRMHAQITGSPGAVAGFFTYLDNYNEQDIEILTNEAENQIHYTTHDNGGAGNGNPTVNTTMSASRSEYVTYRLDWIPGKSSFYTGNDPVKVLTDAVPTSPCTLNMNMWSAGTGWGGAMAEGKSAVMNVQWIEAVYDDASAPSRVRRARSHGGPLLGKRQSGGCANACKVDGGAAPGSPVPA